MRTRDSRGMDLRGIEPLTSSMPRTRSGQPFFRRIGRFQRRSLQEACRGGFLTIRGQLGPILPVRQPQLRRYGPRQTTPLAGHGRSVYAPARDAPEQARVEPKCAEVRNDRRCLNQWHAAAGSRIGVDEQPRLPRLDLRFRDRGAPLRRRRVQVATDRRSAVYSRLAGQVAVRSGLVATLRTVPIPSLSAQPAQRLLEDPHLAVLEGRRQSNRHQAPSDR
jgi:hypothetical protein